MDLICFQKSGYGVSEKNVHGKEEENLDFRGAVGVDRCLGEDLQRH